MSYVAINQIVNLFFQLFGSGVIMAIFVVVFFVIMLFLMRANIATILIVLLPLTLGLAFNRQFTNFIDFAPWVYWILLLAFGLIAGGVIVVSAMRN